MRYSAPPRDGTPEDYDHTEVLSEFRTTDDRSRGDPDSERVLLEVPSPQFNHNAGDLKFGPDGYLYLGMSDGGGADDAGMGHVEAWYDESEGGNGQDTTENLLGSILRIDVDGSDGDRPYEIPDDNPLIDEEGHLASTTRGEYATRGGSPSTARANSSSLTSARTSTRSEHR